MQQDRISLTVYRDLANRQLGEPEKGSLAKAAHEKRRQALEEDLNEPCFMVADWGKTKDTDPHEVVSVIVELLQNPATPTATESAIAFIGLVLSAAFSSLITDGTKYLVKKLVGRMDRREIEEFSITLPAGSTVEVKSDRTVRINLTGGKDWSFNFDTPPKS
jgi:hypothetical protein